MANKLLLSFAAVLLASSANAASVVNGSFEQGTNPGSFTTLGTGSTAITGWTVAAGTVDYIGNYWQASDGVRSVDLSGGSIGTLAQTLSGLTFAKRYVVSFDVARNPDGGTTPRTGTFVANGQTFGFAYTDATSTRANMKWETVSYIFQATGTSADISFSSDSSGGCCFGPALDNVAISAVPEPAAWAMMIGGLGLIGGAARRRRSERVTFA